MSVLDDLRYSLAPIMTPDLDVYCQAIAAMFAETEFWSLDYIDGDGNEQPGWGRLLDVDECPTAALPWLAQLVGEALPTTASDAAARQQIRDQPNRKRGTRAGIIAAAKATLTGAQQVVFRERDAVAWAADPAYGLTVVTYTSQTPSPAVTEAAIRSNIPGGIVLVYTTLAGWDITSFDAFGYANITAFEAAFPAIDQFEVNLV